MRIIIAAVTAVVPVCAWVVAYVATLVATRPRAVTAAPASQDLGREPPAIVNLLTNRWRVTEDAAEATLLDLAARRFLELRQAGDDPMNTTVHLRQQDPGELEPYERLVLERVKQLAVGGVVPVTALTFRSAGHARAWERSLRRRIIRDARDRGLSRRRLSAGQVSALSTGAGFAALGPGIAWYLAGGAVLHSFMAAGVVFALLSGWVGKTGGERDTPAGRDAGARWLGLRDWLRGHEEFDELPPASVAVWDRYLGYGAAVGATHTTSAVLDLGMGNDRLVWSSYGGQWRRVRVRYPRLRPQYGLGGPGLALLVLALLLFAGALSPFAAVTTGLLADLHSPAPVRSVGYGLAGLLVLVLLYALYVLVRGLIDLGPGRIVTGEALWLKVARRHKRKNSFGDPYVHHLAVDDGSGEVTTAWGLPSGDADRIHAGDTVRLRVRPWTRRVVDYRVLHPGARRPDAYRQAAEVA